MPRPRKYPDQLMDRGVRLVFESGRPIARVAADLGVGAEALRKRVRRAEADSGKHSDILTTHEREEIRKLRRKISSCAARMRFSKPRRCSLLASSTQTDRGERAHRRALR
jgi:transposase